MKLSTSHFLSSFFFLFPCSLLAQSSSEFSKPWFEEEPVDSLNVITKSAIIRCKVVNALNAWWECSEDERFIEKRNTPNMYVDPRTGVRHIELQLEVKRRYNAPSSTSESGHSSLSSIGKTHNFECWCNAYGGHQTVSSRRASLQFSTSPHPVLEEDESDVVISPKPVNGGWSPWTSWSTCSHECQQVRKRSCVNPSPKYGGSHCHGADFHIRNCSGGLCRKLDLYQQKREKEEKDSSLRSGRNEQEMYLLSVITTTFFFIFLLFVVIMFRRRRMKNQDTTFVDEETGRQDGHSIHLLLQQQQQQQLLQHPNQSPPDLIRGDKMQLISRLNNFNGNVLEHFVIRNDHLIPNPSPGHVMQQSHPSIPVQTVNPTLNNNPHPVNSHSSSSSSPVSSVALAQQRSRQPVGRGGGPGSVSGASSAGDCDESSEPDYAEPILTSPVTFTPDKRPPLPKSSPPFNSGASPQNQQQRGSQPSTPTRVKPLMNRPPQPPRVSRGGS